jgi:hypothetical protein
MSQYYSNTATHDKYTEYCNLGWTGWVLWSLPATCFFNYYEHPYCLQHYTLQLQFKVDYNRSKNRHQNYAINIRGGTTNTIVWQMRKNSRWCIKVVAKLKKANHKVIFTCRVYFTNNGPAHAHKKSMGECRRLPSSLLSNFNIQSEIIACIVLPHWCMHLSVTWKGETKMNETMI